MSRRPPQPCKYFKTRGGCRAGTNCRFSHQDNDPVRAQSPASTAPNTQNPRSPQQNRHSRNGSQDNGGPSTPHPAVPGGTCRFFWTTGKCKHEFQCRFKHVKAGEPSLPPPQPTFGSIPESTKAAIAPFLTEKGLAKVNAVATDGFFTQEASTSVSPTDAHGRIRRFLQEGYQFRNVFDVYPFLLTLNSANSTNDLWTQEEGQLLLSNLTTPSTQAEGCRRFVEIINWPEVSCRAGSNKTVLSFQRGILPLLRYLSSEFVVKSILVTRANELYSLVLQNLDKLADVIESCVEDAMKRHTFNDPLAVKTASTPIDTQVFASISGLLHEILIRFKNVVASHPRLRSLAENLQRWVRDWVAGINATPPLFEDPIGGGQSRAVRDLIIGSIEERVARVVSIVEREHRKEDNGQAKKAKEGSTTQNPSEALVSALQTTFQGPGILRDGGPRHDNDHDDIYDIRIAPTHQELLCREQPYLPANFFAAPHHVPAESMQRLLDIQFRLLREELTAPLRKAVQLIHDDLKAIRPDKTKLASLIDKQGGKYHGLSDSQESIMFNVYTGVNFSSLIAGWKGLSTSLLIDTPPGRARSERSGARVAFWESMGGKRLIQGGLIALVWDAHGKTSISLGIITSSFRDKEVKAFVSQSRNQLRLQINFFDPEIELRILQSIRSKSKDDGVKLLVESPVMFEAVRPFLEALKAEPELLPFSKYLVHRPAGYLGSCNLEPPKYATLPNFAFQLSSLFPDEANVDDLTLSVSDPASVERARIELRRSRLDPSQADAVVDALTREVALIQGPPGTGKSFTGVEILRVLRENKVGPILMIAFTNHALDHMLSSVLDAGITYKIVRLGRQSNDERIRNYSIETLEMARSESRLDRAFGQQRRELKDTQKNIDDLLKKIVSADVERDSELVMQYIEYSYPEHHHHLSLPPLGVQNVKDLISTNDSEGEAWQRVGRGGKAELVDDSYYSFWKESRDQVFLGQVMTGTLRPWEPPTPPSPKKVALNAFSTLTVEDGQDESDSDDESDSEDGDAEESWNTVQYSPSSRPVTPELPVPSPLATVSTEASDDSPDIHDSQGFLTALGYDQMPRFTHTDRTLAELLDDGGNVWAMNSYERLRLHNFWVDETRRELAENQTKEFQRLRDLHADKLRECNEGRAEARRSLLQTIDIIGCTTTGAAQLTSLLKALSPRVLLVEEAGQVMEAHILGSLVPSIEHLILIGDPLQLRPTLNNFSLSMDSKRGRDLYRFDMSLMERLSESGLPMSQIDVQRRMRPTISSLIRNTLYPKLEDHPLVHEHPDVRGLGKNVFFLNHTHPENDGSDETTSKFNTYEVQMIRDLVMYLLRQGCYSEEGDIVVLCAYLGQLARLRDALASEIAVVIDEKDQAALNDAEDDTEDNTSIAPSIERVNVTKRVKLRTVDNYQGEEGRIVILSLVRNSGDPEDDSLDRAYRHGIRPTIGFLKSRNRTNVALSRAKEGLYILGNAQNLSTHSPMWNSIIQELAEIDSIGPALPIVCHRHSDAVEFVSQPGKLPTLAPDGGCLRPCETRLPCGHLCPYKCHCDDPKHVSVICHQPCRRLCSRGHPCSKLCSADCGQCHFPVSNVNLPCGHVRSSVPCRIGAKRIFNVATDVKKGAQWIISIPPNAWNDAGRRAVMPNVVNHAMFHAPLVKRNAPGFAHIKRVRSLVDRSVYAYLATSVAQILSNADTHAHPKSAVVDLILQRTLDDLVPDSEAIDELVITIPSCGHVFTVETLDGITALQDFYEYNDARQQWTGLKSPQGLIKPPTCPTCRSQITSPRYGRVAKRADLDILERNVAGQMSRSLGKHNAAVSRLREAVVATQLVKGQDTLSLQVPKTMPKRQKSARKAILETNVDLPISERDIQPGNNALFCIDGKVLDMWRKATHPLYMAYKEIVKIATTRSAHTQAWESSFSFLYEREIQLGIENPASLPRTIPPQDHALRMARMQVGQPKPLADKRFLVEAFWSAINIRLILVRVGEVWLNEASNSLSKYTPFHRDQWATYLQFLLNSCERDAEKAHELATGSGSARQSVQCALLCMRTIIERFRFNFSMCKQTGTITQNREDLLERATTSQNEARGYAVQTISDYLNRGDIDVSKETEWIDDNFKGAAEAIINEWEKIARAIRMDTFYEPVSLEEKMAVVKVMNFASTGHFYACPNGHVFVIGECGGAMETARCPECNATIGGRSHQLDSSNTRSAEYDEIARNIDPGIRESPWANPYAA